ncbi:catalase [Colletotrichum chrysophilum]|uniref:Catalase n=1 Tax=Colletotrichum chrysophilum TaxID=1836956 RepID=A0AAD9A4X9_9PEZI|nr:catalase [Colletotrichum chrysophilum]
MSAPTYTLAEGLPYADPSTAQHFGGDGFKGLMLLQDTQLIETLTHMQCGLPSDTAVRSPVSARNGMSRKVTRDAGFGG